MKEGDELCYANRLDDTVVASKAVYLQVYNI